MHNILCCLLLHDVYFTTGTRSWHYYFEGNPSHNFVQFHGGNGTTHLSSSRESINVATATSDSMFWYIIATMHDNLNNADDTTWDGSMD